MMTDWRRSLLPETATIRRALETISGPDGTGIVLAVSRGGTLLGVAVDADIRRALLRGARTSGPLRGVMNRTPFTLPAGSSSRRIRATLLAERRAFIPLVDAAGRVKGLARLSDHVQPPGRRPNQVVLLVGGYGRRLGELTLRRPKPLLPVGDKPLLETIVRQLTQSGFHRFAFAVHHQADQILQHFGDGRRFGVEIRYLRERLKLGTAGPLSLLPDTLRSPVVVMNGDLLTRVDFQALLDFHNQEGTLATMCVREYDVQVPFGVVRTEGSLLRSITEKPVHRFFVNAGIYVIEPAALRLLRRGRPCEMPEFLESLLRQRPRAVSCFPIQEYWIDIGRVGEYRKARKDFDRVFR